MERSSRAAIMPMVTLLAVYFLCRLLFQRFAELKTAFIYPTGYLLHLFYDAGEYARHEWHFVVDGTRFIVGDVCSGTTFFCLLLAYVCCRLHTRTAHWAWLLPLYPVAITANAMRVQSSFYTYQALSFTGYQGFNEFVHVVTGTVTFLCCFLVLAFWVEGAPAMWRRRLEH